MTQAALFEESPALAALRKLQAGGKLSEREATIAIAHGDVYDPHIDGRLRLTSAGLAKLRDA
jgi:hypothetical protein